MSNTLFRNPFVIYHDKCADGFCSAYIIRMALPGAVFYPANYGSVPPDVVGKDVILADFSYPRKTLLHMKEQANSLIVLDHHKSAIEDLAGLKFCVFDVEKSGATLVRDFFFPANTTNDPLKRHWIIDYVEDRDLWKWALPNSQEINAALASYPRDFEVWDALWTHKSQRDLVEEGSAIIRYQMQVASQAIEDAQEILFQGHRVLIANCNSLQSEIANALAKDRAFGVVWAQQSDGRYRYSLRSKVGSGEDVEKIAKLYGGGGHKHAAGFVSNSIIHVSLLKV